MSPKEREYYRERGQAERLRAAEATHALVSEIHEELACLYEVLVELEGEPARPILRIVAP